MTWALSIRTLLKCNIDVEFALANSNEWKMNKYELRWINKDKSGQKDENTERQKTTHRIRKDSTWISMNKDELKWTYMNYWRLTTTKRQIDKKKQKEKETKNSEWDSENIQTTSNVLLKSKKVGDGEGGQYHRDLLTYWTRWSMI